MGILWFQTEHNKKGEQSRTLSVSRERILGRDDVFQHEDFTMTLFHG